VSHKGLGISWPVSWKQFKIINLFSLSRDLKAVTFLTCILEVCIVIWAATPNVLTGNLLFSSDPPIASRTMSWTFLSTLFAVNSAQIKIPFDETPGVMQPKRQTAWRLWALVLMVDASLYTLQRGRWSPFLTAVNADVFICIRNYVSLQENTEDFFIFTPAPHPVLSSRNTLAVSTHAKCLPVYLRYDVNVHMPTSNSMLTCG